MKPLYVVLIAIVFFALLFSVGCNKTETTEPETTIDTLSSKSNSDLGMTEMENQFYFMATNNFNSSGDLDKVDFSKTNTYFKKALQDNPNNLDANIGAALTEVFTVYNDPEIRDAIKKWEDYTSNGNTKTATPLINLKIPTGTKDMAIPVQALGLNFIKIIQAAKTDPPTIGQMQALLKNKLLPRLNYALARLATVESHPEFEMKISGKMQGDIKLSPVYMDLTEIYILDAMVQGIKAVVSEFLVFQFELSSYTTPALVSALNQNNTTFFILAPDGATHSANVKSSILAAIGKIRSAINFLKNETDSQSDDIIKLRQGNNGGIKTSDLDTVLTYLTKAEDAINNGITIDAKDADSDGNDYSIIVKLSVFFDNPPHNPKKDWLPLYTIDTTAHGDILWRWTQQTYSAFTFPDPTLGGIFPNMTNEMLKRLLYIDEEFAWRIDLSLYDNSGQMDANATAKVVLNNKTYLPKANKNYYSSPWNKFFVFYITDEFTGNADIKVTLNSVERQLLLSKPATVQPKKYTYVSANVSLAPQNLNATTGNSPTAVVLSWSNYNYYKIERKIANGSFSVLDSTYSSSYYDYNVSSGTSYSYRITPATQAYFYDYWAIYAVLSNNYSNVVTITAP